MVRAKGARVGPREAGVERTAVRLLLAGGVQTVLGLRCAHAHASGVALGRLLRRISNRARDSRLVAGALVAWGSVTGCTVVDDTTVEVTTADARRFRREVGVAAVEQGIRLTEIRPLDDDLESVFRYLVGGGR